MPYVETACRVLLLTVFAVSAGAKLRDRATFAEFAGSLSAMRLAPAGRGRPIALVVVAAEAGTAVLLALPGPPVQLGLGAAAALLCGLSGGVLLVWQRRSVVPCRCFGGSGGPLGPRHLARNLALLVAAVIGLVAASSGGADHPGGLVVAAGAGALAAVLVVSADDLLELIQPALPTNKKGQ